MLMNPPPRSHGTMPIDVRKIHQFGMFALKSITLYVEHLAAPHNYPTLSVAGEILTKMHSDLRLCLQMYSPTHAKSSRYDFALFLWLAHTIYPQFDQTIFSYHHVTANFAGFIKTNTLAFCHQCVYDCRCFVNQNVLRSILVLAHYGTFLIKNKCMYPTIAQSKYTYTNKYTRFNHDDTLDRSSWWITFQPSCLYNILIFSVWPQVERWLSSKVHLQLL